ncbi:hypothetical protein RZS08_61400, partial [Arthrospira platensis SPKY1]|nr:hypothetical protein [Arthrospira platensis SPKY1]
GIDYVDVKLAFDELSGAAEAGERLIALFEQVLLCAVEQHLRTRSALGGLLGPVRSCSGMGDVHRQRRRSETNRQGDKQLLQGLHGKLPGGAGDGCDSRTR